MVYPNTEPQAADSDNVLLGKILQKTSGGGGGGATGPQGPVGPQGPAGDPATQTPWAQNINGGGFELSNASLRQTPLYGGIAYTDSNLSAGEALRLVNFGNSATTGIFVVDEDFSLGYAANIGSLGIYDGVGAFLKTGAADEAWSRILTGNTDGSIPYVLKSGDTMTGKLTITPAVNTNALQVTGYSLTGSNASSLLDLAGTWNTSGTPTALKVNITNTASNAASLLFDFQVGGNSIARLTRLGSIIIPSGGLTVGTGNQLISMSEYGMDLVGNAVSRVNQVLFTATPANASSVNSSQVICEAANVLAQRNGTAAQAFRLYNTFTTLSTAGEWFKFDWQVTANQFRFGAVRGSSSGTSRAASWDFGAVAAAPTAAITVPATSGNIVFGGGVQLSNAAATGLAAGVLAATTNATIVLYDSTGQAYRIPCII